MRLNNKQRCKNCIHKCVCQYQSYYENVEGLERCKHYRSKEKAKYEQREGKWIKPSPCSQEICDQCGKCPKLIFGMLPNYCPNCGAKMKGGEAE